MSCLSAIRMSNCYARSPPSNDYDVTTTSDLALRMLHLCTIYWLSVLNVFIAMCIDFRYFNERTRRAIQTDIATYNAFGAPTTDISLANARNRIAIREGAEAVALRTARPVETSRTTEIVLVSPYLCTNSWKNSTWPIAYRIATISVQNSTLYRKSCIARCAAWVAASIEDSPVARQRRRLNAWLTPYRRAAVARIRQISPVLVQDARTNVPTIVNVRIWRAINAANLDIWRATAGRTYACIASRIINPPIVGTRLNLPHRPTIGTNREPIGMHTNECNPPQHRQVGQSRRDRIIGVISGVTMAAVRPPVDIRSSLLTKIIVVFNATRLDILPATVRSPREAEDGLGIVRCVVGKDILVEIVRLDCKWRFFTGMLSIFAFFNCAKCSRVLYVRVRNYAVLHFTSCSA